MKDIDIDIELEVIDKEDSDMIKIILTDGAGYRDFVTFMKPRLKGNKKRRIYQQKRALIMAFKTTKDLVLGEL